MLTISLRHGCFLICLVLLLAVCLPCFGQPPKPSPGNDQADSTTVERTTTEMVDAQIKMVEESKDLDEATKKQLGETLAKAKASLQEAETAQQNAAKFTGWIANVAADTSDAESKKKKPAKTYDFATADNKQLAELTNDLAELERQRDAAKLEFETAKNEPKRRTDRLQTISDDIAAARKTLDENGLALEALKQNGAPALVLQARKMQLLASRQIALAKIAAREAERQAYQAQGNLPRLWIEVASERLKQLEADVEKLGGLISDRRQFDAGEQFKDATEAMDRAAEPLKRLWKRDVVDRAQKWMDLADAITKATVERDRLLGELETWREDYEKTVKRAEDASGTIGQLLLRKKSVLPDIAPLRKDFEAREREIREIQSQLYELEDRRLELTDPVGQANVTAEEFSRRYRDLPEDIEEQLVELYTSETLILDQLLSDTTRQFHLLIAASEHQEHLIEVVEDYADFIDQRVFWIRSTAPPSLSDLSHAGQAVGWLIDYASWTAAVQTLVANLRGDLIRSFFAVVFIVVVFYFRGRARRGIKRLAVIAEPRSCRTLAPTIQALWKTVVAAAAWPLLFLLLSWSIRGSGNELVRATSDSLSILAGPLFAIEFLAQLCRRKGLAQSHFMWPAPGVATLKSNLRLLLFAGVPLAFVFVAMDLQGNQKLHASLGRFCYAAFMFLLGFVSYRVFRANGGILESILLAQPNSWLNRLQRVWRAVLVLAPLMLAGLSIAGFYYTSQRLAEYLLQTVVLVYSLVVLGAMLYRWVRVKRRRLRWQQAMEHRERQAGAEVAEPNAAAEIAVEDEEVDLAAIDQQTRRLIRSFLIFAGLIGTWFIWAKVFPMLSLLEQRQVWEMRDAVGGAISITVADILMAILVVGVTIVSAKNVPGLVDILLLERLRIESSIRYAISTLSRYLIAMIGITIVASSLGFSWGKVQWLVAALGVGLGFGLQEIVANFVCGIILLFERPIRVGDVVTLGDTTGVVTKISIRATRIRNWDRQELVIPNKELITGRIVNWTLTDKLNRIVIEVGVAYGSDTRRTRDLLFEILRDQPNVLEDPKPLVTFGQFGDSSLGFTIRAYLSNLDQRLETIHELHTIIHERFGAEGIEIAFPQRDLHVRSVEPTVSLFKQDDSPA